MNKTTTIRIKENTRKRLIDYGRKGETYDFIINKLMDIAEKKENDKTTA
jgi:hypothetical protein